MNIKTALGISAFILLVLGTGAGYFFGYDHGFEKASSATVTSFDECVKDEEVFCTQDAQECPDGTFVGRSGPNCEFAPCPGN
jgi:hypothetical protein